MSTDLNDFTIGIEEEYLLVDKDTRDLASDPPKELMAECEKALEKQVSPEFLRCQIEVGTPVCKSIAEARRQLSHLRRTIAEIASRYNLAPLAVSTHPFAVWSRQQHTDKERYNALARDLQVVVQRMVICGMHVHVGVPDKAMRIDLMNQMSYFLPHLLALSTSSPFWQGRVSGLKSYRLAVFDELPRTGIPETFSSWGEYERTIEILTSAGLIEDATKIWWDMRPSGKFPTLEMRVSDVCTLIDDSLSIAALYACLMRMLSRLRLQNQRWRSYSNFLITENRWRAQRFGVTEKLVDFGKGTLIPFAELVDELIDLVREDADHLQCLAEVEHIRAIAARGTSADNQLKVYNEAKEQGKSEDQALRDVVDMLIDKSLEGC